MDAIREWLNNSGSYDAGAKLYLMYGKDHALRRIFSEPASDFKKRKLAEALKALVTKKVEVEKKIETTKTVAIAHLSNNVREWPEQMDATLAALKEKWKPLFAELMYLSSSIYEVALQGKTDPAKKQEAGKMAHRIIDLDEECDAIYLKRQHYLTYKTLPEEKKPIELVVDVKKIPKALANSERYVRDYKNKLKKNPADVFAAEKLKQYEWAVGEYKKQLNIE